MVGLSASVSEIEAKTKFLTFAFGILNLKKVNKRFPGM